MAVEKLQADYVSARIAALDTRHGVLTNFPVPPERSLQSTGTSFDPFEFEIRGVYVGPQPVHKPFHEDDVAGPTTRTTPKKHLNVRGRIDMSGRVIKRSHVPGTTQALTPTRASKRKAYWDDAQDKILRRFLRKWGWGCWKRIERSGRLPSEYTAKMIANRARALSLQVSEPIGTGQPGDEPEGSLAAPSMPGPANRPGTVPATQSNVKV
jgi:hypothetical protein